MSLTEAETVFASIHEDALNDLLTAFCTDRPRYLRYGSPAFVPATTIAETSIQAIPFPGVPGGIQWRLRLTIPEVDLHKQSAALPPELTLAPGEFSAHLGAQLCLDCRRIRIDPKPPRDVVDIRKESRTEGRKEGRRAASAARREERPRDERHPAQELTCCKLDVYVVGHIEHVLASNGEDAIALAVDAVEVVDIQPAELEAVVECLLFMILQAVLAEIRLPLRALRAGAFQLTLVQGPFIEDDQIKARGNV
jgi:hypothetical protein